MTTVATAPPPVSPAVTQFAAQVGALPHLGAVLELARQCFPDGPVAMFIEADAEVAELRHIVIEVDVSRCDVDGLLEAQAAWSSGLFDVCPAPLAVYFQLGWR